MPRTQGHRILRPLPRMPHQANPVVSASYATNAGSANNATSASFATNAINATNAQSASYNLQGVSASYASVVPASGVTPGTFTGTFTTIGNEIQTGSYNSTGSVNITGPLTASTFQGNGAGISGIISASYAATASVLLGSNYIGIICTNCFICIERRRRAECFIELCHQCEHGIHCDVCASQFRQWEPIDIQYPVKSQSWWLLVFGCQHRVIICHATKS